MGLWAMAEHRAPRVVEAAYEETRNRLLSSPLLAGLGESAPGLRRRLSRGAPPPPGWRAARAAHQEKSRGRGGTVRALPHRSPS